jgi:hypothetical protein
MLLFFKHNSHIYSERNYHILFWFCFAWIFELSTYLSLNSVYSLKLSSSNQVKIENVEIDKIEEIISIIDASINILKLRSFIWILIMCDVNSSKIFA